MKWRTLQARAGVFNDSSADTQVAFEKAQGMNNFRLMCGAAATLMCGVAPAAVLTLSPSALTAAPVPEPGSLALFSVAGLLALAYRKRC